MTNNQSAGHITNQDDSQEERAERAYLKVMNAASALGLPWPGITYIHVHKGWLQVYSLAPLSNTARVLFSEAWQQESEPHCQFFITGTTDMNNSYAFDEFQE